MPVDQREVLLDTHVLLWWQAGSSRLSSSATSLVSSARRLLVSPMSCWEIAMLVAKGRVRLDRPTAAWVRDVLALPRVESAPLTPSSAVAAAELPDFPGDPADRILYATARSVQAVLLTKDDLLHDYAARRRDVVVAW